MSVVSLSGVTKTFGSGSDAVTALRDVELESPPVSSCA